MGGFCFWVELELGHELENRFDDLSLMTVDPVMSGADDGGSDDEVLVGWVAVLVYGSGWSVHPKLTRWELAPFSKPHFLTQFHSWLFTQSSQEIHIHSINQQPKTWLGFFLLYLRQNIKPYTSNGLWLSWKFYQKKKKKNILHKVWSIESNFQSIEPCRNWIVIFCNYSIPTLHINILWASLKQD